MRKYLWFAFIAALVAIMAPLAMADTPEKDAVSAPVAVHHLSLPSIRLRDEAAMVLVGTALIGLAAAVRRAA